VNSLSGGTVVISWDTNVPANSSLVVTDNDTGDIYKSQLDGSMVTHHVAQVSGLLSGDHYGAVATSVDANGRTVSNAPPVLLAP
jgi:hypothetical protein